MSPTDLYFFLVLLISSMGYGDMDCPSITMLPSTQPRKRRLTLAMA